MRVSLIAFDFVYPGIKMLSSYIKSRGAETSIVYLPPEKLYDCSYTFDEKLKAHLSELVKNCDLIGLSVMTHNFHLAADLTRYLKHAGRQLIIWGGIHPTLDPEGCLDYADGVAVGEAEESLSDLVHRLRKGDDPFSTPGFWFRSSGEIIRNRLRPPPSDLNALPLPDIGHQGHYIRKGDTIVPLDETGLKAKFMENGLRDLHGRVYSPYLGLLSRGGPFICS